MKKPINVKALDNFRLWIKFDDGIQGEVDLSSLAGKGVFTLWNESEKFRHVSIGEYGEIVWSPDVEICSDSLYLKLTGKKVDEAFSLVHSGDEPNHA